MSIDQVTMLRPQVVFSVLFMEPCGGRSSAGVVPSTSWNSASAAAWSACWAAWSILPRLAWRSERPADLAAQVRRPADRLRRLAGDSAPPRRRWPPRRAPPEYPGSGPRRPAWGPSSKVRATMGRVGSTTRWGSGSGSTGVSAARVRGAGLRRMRPPPASWLSGRKQLRHLCRAPGQPEPDLGGLLRRHPDAPGGVSGGGRSGAAGAQQQAGQQNVETSRCMAGYLSFVSLFEPYHTGSPREKVGSKRIQKGQKE